MDKNDMREAQDLVAEIRRAVERLRELVGIHRALQDENFARHLIMCGSSAMNMEQELSKQNG